MKIISKFKDYYDFVAGYDTDPRKVYVRDNRTAKHDEKINVVGKHMWNNIFSNNPFNFYLGAVWFCGVEYRYLHDVLTNEFFYSLDDIPENKLEFYEKHSTSDIPQHFKMYGKMSAWKKHWESTREQKDLNKEWNSPIIFSRIRDFMNETVFNGNLNDLQFNKVKNPQEAFTELYNWIPYVEPQMPNSPTDMQRFEGKGFDKKTSFRH